MRNATGASAASVRGTWRFDAARKGQGGSLTNLNQRIISAVVLAAIVLAATWYGGLAFRLVAAIIGAGMIYEWCLINTREISTGMKTVTYILAGVALLALLGGVDPRLTIALAAGGTVALFVAGAVAGGGGWWAAAGLAYALASAIALAGLRGDNSMGLVTILFLFAVVWGTDIFAYFVGRSLGGPKLAPKISPNKTISGAVGGMIGGVTAAMLVAYWFLAVAGLGLVLLAACLSAISQVGDLFESAIKRHGGVKDSSHLIPGHGGVLDRVDALVAAAVALYIAGLALAGFDAVSGELLSIVAAL